MIFGYCQRLLLISNLICLSYESVFAKVQIEQSVKIGGIQQWIEIKSEKDNNPVLLFLHGGPGNSAMGYAHKFTSELEKHFIVVLWDQRETGKTLQLNPTTQPLSLSLIEADAHEMIEYLCARFSQSKIYVMGHSWGGFLALRMALLYPERLEVCFAISPMIAQFESEQLSLAWLIEQAKRTNNRKAQAELANVKVPFQNADQIFTHRYWLAKFTKGKPAPRSFVQNWAVRWLNVFNEASAIDLRTKATTIHCPVFLFIGQNDYQTHFSLAKEYYELLNTKKKELFWFKNSGHNLNLTEPKILQEKILSKISFN